MDPHEHQQVVFQDLLVTSTIHCRILWQEVEASMSQGPREAPPDHYAVRMFHSFDCVAAVVSVAPLGPPDGGPG